MYDLIVIGAGSGGLTAVDFAQSLGARVALIEKDKLGGDCTWAGCIPSKALIHVANRVQAARAAACFGLSPLTDPVDMVQVKAYVQKTIRAVYDREAIDPAQPHGYDFYKGEATFVGPHDIEVDGRRLSARKFLIATGAHPYIPPLPGLAESPFHTYQTIFENDRLPQHLLILGAGPVGTELSQAYRRLGAAVTLIDVALLPQSDAEAAALLTEQFAREQIAVVRGLATAVSYEGDHYKLHVTTQEGPAIELSGDMLLVAVGRRPNVAGLGLDKAGVVADELGIQVNDHLQTSAGHVYAAGDCTGGLQLTHFAGWQAYKAVRNALLPGHSSGLSQQVPQVTFTTPEVAQIGLTEQEAAARIAADFKTVRRSLAAVDRAQTDDASDGFVKIIMRKDGRIVGATIVAPRAGEMISEIAVAMHNDLKLADLAHVIHPYPTYSMAIQMMASEQAMSDFATSGTGRALKWWRRRGRVRKLRPPDPE